MVLNCSLFLLYMHVLICIYQLIVLGGIGKVGCYYVDAIGLITILKDVEKYWSLLSSTMNGVVIMKWNVFEIKISQSNS